MTSDLIEDLDTLLGEFDVVVIFAMSKTLKKRWQDVFRWRFSNEVDLTCGFDLFDGFRGSSSRLIEYRGARGESVLRLMVLFYPEKNEDKATNPIAFLLIALRLKIFQTSFKL